MGDQNTGKPSRMWRMMLVVSLALNLAVVGLVVGVAASGKFGDKGPRNLDFGLGPLARALERDERRQIGVALRRDGALRDVDLRGQVNALVEALKAEPFDANAVRAIITEQNTRMAQIQTTAQELVIDQITNMSPERRAAFADRLQDEMVRRRRPRDN